MARNIRECTKRKFGRLYCAFMKLKEDPETGQLEECGCIAGLKDEYRIFPEHSSNGDVVHQSPARLNNPFPYGINVIWENDSNSDNGNTFSFRRLRAEEYNMHPLYTINEINEPTTHGVLANDQIGTAFGLEDVSLSTNGWADQKILGLQRVEDCNMGIYGRFDKVEKMVLPKCLRDYTGDVKGWVNYTPIPDNPRPKRFFACDEPDKKIAAFCTDKFGKTTTSVAIYQILVAIKHGEFINLYEALLNNNVSRAHAMAFMNEVSTKSKSTLYSNMNLMKYFYLWKCLPKMGLPEEKVHLFRCHLMNYVLNYPGLTKMDMSSTATMINASGRMYYPPNRRYWWVVLMVNEALQLAKTKKTPIITNVKIAWFHKFKAELEKPGVNLDLTEFEKNPAVATIYSIIGEKKDTPAFKRRVRVFSRLLLAGKRWNPPEIKITWEYFTKAYDTKDPQRFWQYVENVRGCSPHALFNIREAVGILDDDMEFSPQRAFAHHLLEARKSRTSFEVEEPKVAERWSIITPKHPNNEMDDDKMKIEYSQIFWEQLKRIWSSGKNRYENIFQMVCDHFPDLSRNRAGELAMMYQDEMEEDVLIGRSLSKDDLSRDHAQRIEDIDGNEVNEEGTWQPDSE